MERCHPSLISSQDTNFTDDPLVASEFDEWMPALSPNGRWLAYTSNRSGRNEVYVSPFPNVDSTRVQVSTEGAILPVWASEPGQPMDCSDWVFLEAGLSCGEFPTRDENPPWLGDRTDNRLKHFDVAEIWADLADVRVVRGDDAIRRSNADAFSKEFLEQFSLGVTLVLRLMSDVRGA